ncbi:unnamed protein product [Cyclocybe aegerita]|uniref:MFS general substrate transporter n=1 Tax=Cyclocybe aegerita TaxID=1973307 RepID=A0A8S0WSA8_CYCAE|nr:unnamed protein product [Cyclocybe aegerita]
MANNPPIPPPLISVPRITTLIASLVVALSSGTNYVYSAYAPQLGARLGISHTKLNVVGLAGNVGVYSSGPIWGRIVDTRGPRILLAFAFVFLLGGYSGMRHLYEQGLPKGIMTLSTTAFVALATFSFLTGAGGNGGLTSAVNSTAKTFPDKARASTTGLVISGFGLSAFFFSTISRMFFAGNTSFFLLVLAVGTSFPMIMGFFLVRPIPLPAQEGYDIVEDAEAAEEEYDARTTGLAQPNASVAHLLDHDFIEPRHPHYVHHVDYAQDEDSGQAPVPAERPRSLSRGSAMAAGILPNVYGKKLWRSGDFWLLCSILSMLSGTGLMYINNVGSMSQALYAHKEPHYDDVVAAGWQATQVSTISLTNFLGRIFIGLVSDFAKNKFNMPRSYCLVIVATFFFVSQLATANIDRIAHLWIASALLGLAHGSVFSLFPTVCLEWFGMPHFSENWGYLSMSPMVAGNLFSLFFGRNLDAHENAAKHKATPLKPGKVSAPPQCLQGLECYVTTIYLTMAATLLSILLSVLAAYRDKKKIDAAKRKRVASARAEVFWEADERGI